jgi:hypothetical protein
MNILSGLSSLTLFALLSNICSTATAHSLKPKTFRFPLRHERSSGSEYLSRRGVSATQAISSEEVSINSHYVAETRIFEKKLLTKPLGILVRQCRCRRF